MNYKEFTEQFEKYEKKCFDVLNDVMSIDLKFHTLSPCHDGIEFGFTDDYTKGIQVLHIPTNVLANDCNDEEYKDYIEEMKELFEDE